MIDDKKDSESEHGEERKLMWWMIRRLKYCPRGRTQNKVKNDKKDWDTKIGKTSNNVMNDEKDVVN